MRALSAVCGSRVAGHSVLQQLDIFEEECEKDDATAREAEQRYGRRFGARPAELAATIRATAGQDAAAAAAGRECMHLVGQRGLSSALRAGASLPALADAWLFVAQVRSPRCAACTPDTLQTIGCVLGSLEDLASLDHRAILIICCISELACSDLYHSPQTPYAQVGRQALLLGTATEASALQATQVFLADFVRGRDGADQIWLHDRGRMTRLLWESFCGWLVDAKSLQVHTAN